MGDLFKALGEVLGEQLIWKDEDSNTPRDISKRNG